MQMFGEIPFIKPQNDIWTTDKRLKTMKNEKKRKKGGGGGEGGEKGGKKGRKKEKKKVYLVLVEFLQLVRSLEDWTRKRVPEMNWDVCSLCLSPIALH